MYNSILPLHIRLCNVIILASEMLLPSMLVLSVNYCSRIVSLIFVFCHIKMEMDILDALDEVRALNKKVGV